MLSLKGVDRVDRELLEYFKTVLNDQKKNLLAQANQTVSHNVIKEGDHLSDYADIASSESDRTFHLRIRDRERKLIKKIDQALERIDDGTFGLCERCGEEIDSERLKARPVTTYCIDCKTKLEKEEIE
jgi:DnaK suppressor protein